MANQQKNTSTIQLNYVRVSKLIRYSHNNVYFTAAMGEDGTYIDITKANPAILAAIGGIYSGDSFYKFSAEQVSELARAQEDDEDYED